MRAFYSSLCVLAMLLTPQAHAGFTQRAIEAEQVSGGTNGADLGASAGTAVTRSTDGIYAWWVSETTDLTPGTYSVYARVALAPGVSTARNFTPHFYYGNTQLGVQNVVVDNKQYRWLRVSSIDLPQVGAQLRISDWSNAGLRLDKLAIVKDVQLEAETTYNVPVVSDPSASGGSAVARTNDGIYTYLSVPTAELAPGDYEVHVRLRSSDGAAHSYTGHVTLDNTSLPTVSLAVASTTYQWLKFNEFTYAGGTQTVLVGDWSQAGLVVDAVRLVRRTPYDRQSSVQALFASGSLSLGPPEEVVFNGKPTGFSDMRDPGRVSIVQVNASTLYAYFRQQPFGTNYFQIYMARSTDGGKTFELIPEPIIPRGYFPAIGAAFSAALDPHVTKRADGYYMVFEAWEVTGCGVASVAAYSPDGVTNWQVRNIVVCSQMGAASSASVPNYFEDVQTGTQFLQWGSVDDVNHWTGRFQAVLPSGPLQDRLRFSSHFQLSQYALPAGAPGSWESQNNSAGDVIYEDGYYYHVYDGADDYRCGGTWRFGLMRTSTPSVLSSWTRSAKNPFLTAGTTGSCWLQYPTIVSLPQGVYLYYNDPFTYWAPENKRATFRRKLLPN